MIINVRVNCNAKNASITKNDSGLLVNMNIKPIDGKANEMLISILSKYYDVPKSSVSVLRGQRSRIKMIEIVQKN